jgi:hypothetical protein
MIRKKSTFFPYFFVIRRSARAGALQACLPAAFGPGRSFFDNDIR